MGDKPLVDKKEALLPSSLKVGSYEASSPKGVDTADSPPKAASVPISSPKKGSPTPAATAGILPAQHWVQAAEVCESSLIRD